MATPSSHKKMEGFERRTEDSTVNKELVPIQNWEKQDPVVNEPRPRTRPAVAAPELRLHGTHKGQQHTKKTCLDLAKTNTTPTRPN
jgi:hypothetical protein